MKILIVKTSALGDIIQSFPVLNVLYERFPNASIDWAVEESLSSVVSSHPIVHKTISVPVRKLKKQIFSLDGWRLFWKSLKELRKEKYQLVFDLQGNCKSGVITFLSRGKTKIGFSFSSAREWPNILATHNRFSIPKGMNIRLQYLHLVGQFFQEAKTDLPSIESACALKIEPSEKAAISKLLYRSELSRGLKVMVCPGSKWVNKQLPLETMVDFLSRIQKNIQVCFVLIWGSLEEKRYCEFIQERLKIVSVLADLMSLSAWQYLMSAMDLVIAVDSSALHLCATTSTPSFSIFGPTSSDVFKPLGPKHYAFQGKCPYGRSFLKQCPILRSCKTGACVRELTAAQLEEAFIRWWNHHLE